MRARRATPQVIRETLRPLALPTSPLCQADGPHRADPTACHGPAWATGSRTGGRGVKAQPPSRRDARRGRRRSPETRLRARAGWPPGRADAAGRRPRPRRRTTPRRCISKGVVAIRRGLTEEGARLMERSVALGPVRPITCATFARCFGPLGRYDEALDCGRRAAAGDPADPILPRKSLGSALRAWRNPPRR